MAETIQVRVGENTRVAQRAAADATTKAAEAAASAASTTATAAQGSRIAIRREALPDTRVETEAAARAAADQESDIRLMIHRLGGKTIYCRKGATGANNGTSWTDAYTSVSTAVLAAVAGDRVLLSAPLSDPFPATAIASAALADYIEIDGGQGPDGDRAWFTALVKPANWSDETGGVFKTTSGGSAVAACYNLVADTLSGTTSGVDLTTAENVSDLADYGVKASDCVPWLGSLKKSATATTTPAEGEFSVSGGALYINPPGSPTLAEVNAGAGYCINTDCLSLTKTGSVHRGLSVRNIGTFYAPTETAGWGYGVKHNGCRDSAFNNVLSIMAGYHAVGTIGNSGTGIVFRNCVSVQQASYSSGVANPFVFYSSGDDMPVSGYKADRMVCIGIPLLNASGVPVRTAYYPILGLSHTDALSITGGVVWSRCLQIDFVQEVMTKSGATLTTAGGFIQGADSGATFSDDSGGFPNKVYGGKARGLCAFYNHYMEYRGTEIDREGYGSAGLILFAMSSISGPAPYRVIGGTLKTGDFRRIFSVMAADDLIIFEGTRIVLQATAETNNPAFIHATHTTANRIRFRSCIFDSVAACPAQLVQGSGSLALSWPNVGAAITSDGANIFGENIVEFVGSETSQTGLYVPKDEAWWRANVSGAATDFTAAVRPIAL